VRADGLKVIAQCPTHDFWAGRRLASEGSRA
jgi:hypothetical protein